MSGIWHSDLWEQCISCFDSNLITKLGSSSYVQFFVKGFMGPLVRGVSLEALPRRRTVKSHIQRNSVTVKTRFAYFWYSSIHGNHFWPYRAVLMIGFLPLVVQG